MVKAFIKARSAAEQFTLTVRQEPELGVVTIPPDKPAYDRMEVVALSARLFVPEVREREIDHWEINGSPRSYNPARVIVMRDSEAVASYRRK